MSQMKLPCLFDLETPKSVLFLQQLQVNCSFIVAKQSRVIIFVTFFEASHIQQPWQLKETKYEKFYLSRAIFLIYNWLEYSFA